jgi:hypothetical protein
VKLTRRLDDCIPISHSAFLNSKITRGLHDTSWQEITAFLLLYRLLFSSAPQQPMRGLSSPLAFFMEIPNLRDNPPD